MLFSFSNYQHIANGLKGFDGLEETPFTIARYDNWELHAAILSPVARKHCFILGTIAPPDAARGPWASCPDPGNIFEHDLHAIVYKSSIDDAVTAPCALITTVRKIERIRC